MNRYLVTVFLFIVSIATQAQFTEILSPTGPLTPHWKKLTIPSTPAYLKEKYYTKLDDETFISTDGTAAGTLKLSGFTNIKSIANYVATANYLYYTVYTSGKIYINRYNPVTQQHSPVKNGSRLFTEEDESILVFSVFNNKLLVSCWQYMRSSSKTFTKLYAIHDADTSAASWLLSASVNQNGILDGPVGLSDDQVITRFNLEKPGQPSKTIIYAFGFNDTLNGNYSVKKNYDFTEIGLLINSVVSLGNDVLFVLNNKTKLEAKQQAGSIWLLRNKSAKKLGDLPLVKSNSLTQSYRSGEMLFLVFDEAVYSFNSRTASLKNELALQPNESFGLMTNYEYLQRKGDTLWFRIGTKQSTGIITYQLHYINLAKQEGKKLVTGLPERFTTSFLFDQPSLYYPYINGQHIYYCEGFNGNGAQLYQYSLITGQTIKIVPPNSSTATYEGITELLQLGSTLLIKAYYKKGKETLQKTFFYKML